MNTISANGTYETKKDQILRMLESNYSNKQNYGWDHIWIEPVIQPVASKSYFYKVAKENDYNISFNGAIIVLN